MTSPRQRFLSIVRQESGARPVVSPFLPDPGVVRATLHTLGLPAGEDPVQNEARLARALDYEPMFMTDCPGLIFPWREDPAASDEEAVCSVLETSRGTWTKRVSRRLGEWGDDSGFPLRTEADHVYFVAACEEIGSREGAIRAYFRQWRARVGEEGVIVIGHPHVTWLAYQISQQNLIFHAADYPETFRRSLAAVQEAALFIFQIALQEGIDFMSESCSGLEMVSPAQFVREDLPVLRALGEWTHAHNGLYWYHNCGMTRKLILAGWFNRFEGDVIETVAPYPEGDNDLAESRRHLARSICSKGNLGLYILRDGTVDEVAQATREMVAATRGYYHIHSTADAVLPGTPPENLIAFVRTARAEAEK